MPVEEEAGNQGEQQSQEAEVEPPALVDEGLDEEALEEDDFAFAEVVTVDNSSADIDHVIPGQAITWCKAGIGARRSRQLKAERDRSTASRPLRRATLACRGRLYSTNCSGAGAPEQADPGPRGRARASQRGACPGPSS